MNQTALSPQAYIETVTITASGVNPNLLGGGAKLPKPEDRMAESGGVMVLGRGTVNPLPTS